jgi:formate hydrogenlyase subunit 3/multisubunit Na+/H+ antiporter MnhD subunit
MDYVAGLALLLPLLCLSTRLLFEGAAGKVRTCLVMILAPLPLLVLGIVGSGGFSLPLLLLASDFGVGPTNRPLLILAGLGWSLAGWFAADFITERGRSFGAFWLLTLTGQAVALLSADLSGFYLGYVLMTFSAYGLVVHACTPESVRAGRVYIVLSIIGEALVLSGLLMLGALYDNIGFAALRETPVTGVAPWLLITGFAVKLGIVPLHMWLPLAHPVAPAPASAILSGLLVKAGLLGMLRFVPPEALTPVLALNLLVAAGLFTAAYGAIVGLMQSRLKTVLAYSTISQMGLVLAGFAAVEALGETAPAALGLFAMHHGLNKVALFLAAGHRMSGYVGRVLFLLPVAALAGLPLTSGMAAKVALKHGLDSAGAGPWLIGLSLSSVLTTLLLLHAYRLWCAQDKGRASPHPAWVTMAAAGLFVPWVWAMRQVPLPGLEWLTLWDSFWPVALGVGVFAAWHKLAGGRRPAVPEGDLVALFEPALRGALRVMDRFGALWMDWEPKWPNLWPRQQVLNRAERAVGRLAVAGMFLLLVILSLWLAMT